MNYIKQKKMNKEQYITIRDLSFKTIGYHKNFDLMITGESIINEYEGKISKLQILQKKLPLQVGEYSISTWDLDLGRKLKVNIFELFQIHADEPTYDEFNKLIKDNQSYVNDYNKIVFIHSLILTEDYRKKQIVEEFTEFIYREYHNEKILIVALVLPVQYNSESLNFYTNINWIINQDDNSLKLPASKYYGLDKIISDNPDQELNEIKLFSVAQKCGFERIDESYLFKLNPTKIIERLEVKWRLGEKL